jgi:Periplasmic glycine betaine/choline-binding (lipo)protein of an ABC-type transport system (osmoprotectant binding protein)
MKAVRTLSAIAIVLMLVLGGCGGGGDRNGGSGGSGKITVGSKNFTENILLAHMMAILIEENTDIRVERKVNLGGSNVAWQALLNNDIQLYLDYTGTIVANYYQQETGDAEETLQRAQELVKQDHLKFLEPWGFNNTYTLAVKQELAEELGLSTYSDLAKVSDQLVIGSEFEFLDRPDGLPGLKETYGMSFREEKGMDAGLRYPSIQEGKVDVINAFATDGMLVVYQLKILEDDKSFFPPYHGAPLVRQDTLEQYPEIEDLLNRLAGKIDDETMQSLNAKVDSEGLKEEDVAREFLIEQGLIEG